MRFCTAPLPEKSSGYGSHTHTSYRNGKKRSKIHCSVNKPTHSHAFCTERNNREGKNFCAKTHSKVFCFIFMRYGFYACYVHLFAFSSVCYVFPSLSLSLLFSFFEFHHFDLLSIGCAPFHLNNLTSACVTSCIGSVSLFLFQLSCLHWINPKSCTVLQLICFYYLIAFCDAMAEWVFLFVGFSSL